MASAKAHNFIADSTSSADGLRMTEADMIRASEENDDFDEACPCARWTLAVDGDDGDLVDAPTLSLVFEYLLDGVYDSVSLLIDDLDAFDDTTYELFYDGLLEMRSGDIDHPSPLAFNTHMLAVLCDQHEMSLHDVADALHTLLLRDGYTQGPPYTEYRNETGNIPEWRSPEKWITWTYPH
jgi:hypothetical protein